MLHQEQDADVRDLFLQITRDMVIAKDVDQLLQTMVDAALGIVDRADKCVIHLLSGDHTLLEPRICSRPMLQQPVVGGIPADAGIAGRALRERRAISVQDTLQESAFAPLQSGPEVRSLLVAPLYVGDSSLGTLSLSSTSVGAFHPHDCHNIETLAAQASVAIWQANLLQRALLERARNDAIIETMSDGLLILDGQGRMTRFNVNLARMLGLDAAKLVLPCCIDDAQQCPPQLFELLRKVPADIPAVVEVAITKSPDAKQVLRMALTPLGEPQGAILCVVHDVTPERQAAEMRAVFISQVAHELRAPLQHVMSFANLLSDRGDLPAGQCQDYVRYIEEETSNLGRLVDDLLELSRIEAGRFSLHLEYVQLDRLLADVVNRLLPQAQLKGLDLRLGLAQEAVVLTDPLRMEQVISNLIDNAIKFVPRGGRIDVTQTIDDQSALVRVADTGPGISSDGQARVFERFYQERITHRAAENPGMGLGLYISREIVRALGGDIWVESQLGKGSVFSFRLPLSSG